MIVTILTEDDQFDQSLKTRTAESGQLSQLNQLHLASAIAN